MSRDRLMTAGLVAASCVLALALVELICRLADIGSPNPHWIDQAGLFVKAQDHLLSYRLAPGYDGWVYGARVQINSRGLREPESVRYEKDSGVIRVVCLGDSVVFGYGVERENALPAVLEELLGARSDAELQVINMGIPGYNTAQEVRFLELEGERYDPDIVLLFVVINDSESIRTLSESGRLLPVPEDIWLRLIRKYGSLAPPDTPFYCFNALRRTLFSLTSRYRQMTREVKMYYTEEIFKHEGWQTYKEALARLHAWEKESGARVIPVILPMLTEFDNHPYVLTYERFAKACGDAGLNPLNSWPALRKCDPQKLRLHPLDGHPGAYGHRMIAQFVADRLEIAR